MAIYGISDLHLSFGTNKPMNIFGKIWNDYENKIKENWIRKVKNDDVVIIAGDISWATYLSQAKEDFNFINELPGKKIILRGNHDYYFETLNKQEKFFKDNGFNTLTMLHNNCFDLDEYILCGTRGWGETEDNSKDDEKILRRESLRLRLSLEKGKIIQEQYLKKGIKKDILVAIHFPPFGYDFQKILEEYKIKKCIYGHLHGYGHSKIKEGIINDVEYVMVSVDYTGFDVIKL